MSDADNIRPLDQQQLERDAMSMVLLGSFFAALATLVLIGTFWTIGRHAAMVVNIGAGAVLMLIGLFMLYLGARIRRKAAALGVRNAAR